MSTRLKLGSLFKCLNTLAFFADRAGDFLSSRRLSCELIDSSSVLFIATLLISQISNADDVEAQFSKVGDATHLEFSGKTSWNYNLRREDGKVVLNVPKVDDQTKAHLDAWKDGLVQKVSITSGPDGGDEITFTLSKEVESFDYLTDQPSRLVLDFFKASVKETKAVAKKPAPKPAHVAKKVGKSSRAPASVESEKDKKAKVAKQTGNYDAADPDYERFNILESDINENSVIASHNNIYLNFPIYDYPTPVLKDFIEAPPIYEIKPEDSDENKKARLLLTLFNKKRAAVFFKTLEFFNKQYPKSKYDEIIRYMEADLYYGFYLESKDAISLERATSRYLQLTEHYPDSLLSERTTLFVAYSYFERGDFLNAMKVLNRFEKRYPNSKWISQVRLSLADTHKAAHHPEDALKVLESVENDSNAREYSTIAAFKKGDVYFGMKEYGKAISEYKKYFYKFPTVATQFPNAQFNIAESYFWLGQYKLSLDAHRTFVRLFPRDSYGGYSITRIGELLDIMGAPKKKVDGAYLESLFRYQGTEGANVAKVRMISERMERMKEKELEAALEDVKNFSETSKLPRAKEFATILTADGYNKRKDYKIALDLLIKFYKDNPTSDLEIFKKRIRDNIIHQLQIHVAKGEFIDAFKIYGEYVAVWLKNNDRIDVEYYLARSFEQAGVETEAAEYFRKVLNRLYAIQGTSEEKERRVLEDLPSTESVNLRLASLTVSQKDFAKAAFYLDSIKYPAKLKPEEQIERIELSAIVVDERGQSDKAKSYLKDLIGSWKGQPALVSGPYLRLAELQMKSKDYDEAVSNLQKVINLDTDSKLVPESRVAKALELKGDIFVAMDKKKEAIASYRKLLDRFEDNMPLESVRYQIGKLQFETGNMPDAEKTWSALKPDTLWASLAKEQLENSRWNQQYKKYLNRIPAMANSK